MNDKEIEKEVERKENFLPSGSLNTKPPTVLLLLLQYIQIQFSTSLNTWVGVYLTEEKEVRNRGE